MKDSKEILNRYSDFLEPIIGKSELHTRLLKGLNDLLFDTSQENTDRASNSEILNKMDPKLLESIDKEVLKEIESKEKFSKGLAQRLIHTIWWSNDLQEKTEPRELYDTNYMALKLYNLGVGSKRHYGKKSAELLKKYLQENRLIPPHH